MVSNWRLPAFALVCAGLCTFLPVCFGATWAPVPQSERQTAVTAAQYCVSLLSLQGLYQQMPVFDSLVTANSLAVTPRRLSLVTQIEHNGRKSILNLETYQDSRNNYKLIYPSPMKSIKHNAYEAHAVQANLWVQANDDDTTVTEAFNALVRNYQLFEPAFAGAKMDSILHSEKYERDVAKELQAANERISTLTQSVSASNTKVAELKAQKLAVLQELQATLLSATVTGKQANVDALDAQIDSFNTQIEKFSTASQAASESINRITADIPSIQSEVQQEADEASSGSLVSGGKTYVLGICILKVNGQSKRVQGLMYKDGQGTWHVKSKQLWTL